jgi:hypothetical protein
MMTYKFATADNIVAQRNDNAFIPWSPVASDGPSDKGGSVYHRWKDEGSPIPDPYVAPAPTADEVRTAQFNGDTDRQDIVSAAGNATPQQIKNYINNNVTDLASAKVMLIKLALLVAKTIRN